MKRRVVITGMGVITSLGEVVDELWENVCAGKSGIGPITRWDASKYPTRFGGECASFDITKYGVDTREAKRLVALKVRCMAGKAEEPSDDERRAYFVRWLVDHGRIGVADSEHACPA